LEKKRESQKIKIVMSRDRSTASRERQHRTAHEKEISMMAMMPDSPEYQVLRKEELVGQPHFLTASS